MDVDAARERAEESQIREHFGQGMPPDRFAEAKARCTAIYPLANGPVPLDMYLHQPDTIFYGDVYPIVVVSPAARADGLDEADITTWLNFFCWSTCDLPAALAEIERLTPLVTDDVRKATASLEAEIARLRKQVTEVHWENVTLKIKLDRLEPLTIREQLGR